MTLSRREFDRSMRRLLRIDTARLERDAETSGAGGAETDHSDGIYNIVIGGVRGAIRVEEIEPVLMGGLVRLPRCRVVIEFGETTNDQRLVFLNKFDMAFQRGGG